MSAVTAAPKAEKPSAAKDDAFGGLVAAAGNASTGAGREDRQREYEALRQEEQQKQKIEVAKTESGSFGLSRAGGAVATRYRGSAPAEADVETAGEPLAQAAPQSPPLAPAPVQTADRFDGRGDQRAVGALGTNAKKAPAAVTPTARYFEQDEASAEIKEALAVLDSGAKGLPRADALKRLCDAYENAGDPRRAKPYCDALLAEFKNSAASEAVVQRRRAQLEFDSPFETVPAVKSQPSSTLKKKPAPAKK